MAQDITQFEAKVDKFLLSREFQTICKNDPKHVRVTSTHIEIDGMNEPFGPKNDGPKNESFGPHRRSTPPKWRINVTWDLTIPLANIRDVFYSSFKAEGAMNYHKDAVGVEAFIDGSVINYAIFTKHPAHLFKVIQDARTQTPLSFLD